MFPGLVTLAEIWGRRLHRADRPSDGAVDAGSLQGLWTERDEAMTTKTGELAAGYSAPWNREQRNFAVPLRP